MTCSVPLSWQRICSIRQGPGVPKGTYMKRTAALLAVASVVLFAVAGCGSAASNSSTSNSSASKAPAAKNGLAPGDAKRQSTQVAKDTVFLTPTKSYNPADFPRTAMTGAPSNIPFFKPVHDEGVVNRTYPAFDDKTFKFLDVMNQCIAPQWYYMFDKSGGTLNKAVASTGFKFASIQDSGHTKMMPNFMLGYYDFAWVPGNIVTELWSGHETQYQELWREGDDYVVVGASYDGANDLLAPPNITSVSQLAGKTVGIMNPSFHTETMLNSLLAKYGLATESAGGNVKVEMGTPGFIMNDLLTKKLSAAFVWGKYTAQLKSQASFKSLVKWQDQGFGSQVPSLWLVVRKDIIAKYPQLVQAVVQANYDATKKAQASNEWLAPNTAAYNAYWTKSYGAQPNIVTPPQSLIDAQANPAFLHGIIDYMTKCGYFKVPYTYNQLVDDSFYNNVKK